MTYHWEAPVMASRVVTPLRLGGAILVVLAITAATVIVLYGPDDGRWGIIGAIGASPERSASAPSEPSQSPTTDAGDPSPSASPSLSLKEKNIAEAKARLVEYYATMAKVANDGFEDWERKLGPFWGTPAVRSGKGEVYERSYEEGVSTAGSATVISARVVKYEPFTPGSEEVTLATCIDFSNVTTFDSNGNRVPRDASVPARYTFTYVLRNQGQGQNWALVGEDPNLEKTC